MYPPVHLLYGYQNQVLGEVNPSEDTDILLSPHKTAMYLFSEERDQTVPESLSQTTSISQEVPCPSIPFPLPMRLQIFTAMPQSSSPMVVYWFLVVIPHPKAHYCPSLRFGSWIRQRWSGQSPGPIHRLFRLQELPLQQLPSLHEGS